MGTPKRFLACKDGYRMTPVSVEMIGPLNPVDVRRDTLSNSRFMEHSAQKAYESGSSQ